MDGVTDVRTVSLKLSEVLSDIGVNERVIQLRRKSTLVKESLENISGIFTTGDDHGGTYHFGSQSEGSTTLGLNSDLDVLHYSNRFNVIQDWAEWKHGVTNLLIVRDGTTPGYCLLQLLQSDTPLAETRIVDNDCIKDDNGRILFRNTVAYTIRSVLATKMNGPAGTVEGLSGQQDLDIVKALHCESWPQEGRDWLDRQCIGNWPSENIKMLAASKGCFLVPVSSKCNTLAEVEWRISTSMAERLMMFNMNITQLRCYVMMKIISKTFFTMNGESTITSFMCKCILFYSIETTRALYWRDDNLFACVLKCLSTLQDCVQSLNCPHYVIPGNNIMANRINDSQQRYLLTVLNSLINFNPDQLFAIQIDDLGRRLQTKLSKELSAGDLSSQQDIERIIIITLLTNQARKASINFDVILEDQEGAGLLQTTLNVVQGIGRLLKQYRNYGLSDIIPDGCTYFVPLLCSLIGAILASFSVYTSKTVSPDAILWFSAGFCADVSSSRLKLASAYYCAGDMNNAELTLRELELMYNKCVLPICGCYPFEIEPIPAKVMLPLCRNNALLNKSVAFCVKFLRCETPIIPQELRQELFRSTEEEIRNRSDWDAWMDFAVVDSLPYLYFMQSKVFKKLGREQQQRKALSNLETTTLNERSLGHRETAWNLLGQCMEQERKPLNANWCYKRSLEVRPHNNAANFYIKKNQR